MARRRASRRKKQSRSKYKTAFNLKNAGLSYLTLATMTQTIGNLAPIPFFLGGFAGSNYFGSAGAGASDKITLIEILKGGTIGTGGALVRPVMDDIKVNLRNNAGKGVAMLVGLKVADKLIGKLGVSRAFNKTVRSVGMGSLIKM